MRPACIKSTIIKLVFRKLGFNQSSHTPDTVIISENMPLESLTFTAAVGVFFGGLITACGKEFLDSLKICYSVERNVRLAILSSSKSLIVLEKSLLIDHDPFEKILMRCIRVGIRCGGVSVLGCPAGSGKSTYIGKYIPVLARENNVGFIFLNVDSDFLSQRGLHHHLGIPRTKRISEYIPKGTIIVLDQCDLKFRHIKPEMEQYIVDLATDSRNTRSFHVIICVSNSDVFADMVIRYNNGQKISQLCLPSAIKWTHNQIKNYINASLPNWTTNDREKFAALFNNVESPGPVWDALQIIEVDSLCSYEDLDASIQARICVSLTTLAKSWVEFDKVERELFGDAGSDDPTEDISENSSHR
jgi:hypothetical protein